MLPPLLVLAAFSLFPASIAFPAQVAQQAHTFPLIRNLPHNDSEPINIVALDRVRIAALKGGLSINLGNSTAGSGPVRATNIGVSIIHLVFPYDSSTHGDYRGAYRKDIPSL